MDWDRKSINSRVLKVCTKFFVYKMVSSNFYFIQNARIYCKTLRKINNYTKALKKTLMSNNFPELPIIFYKKR